MIRHFVYYGFDKDIYDSVREMRDQINRTHTRIAITLFLIVMFMASALSTLKILPQAHRFMYYEYFALTLVFQLFLILAKGFTGRHTQVFTYLMALLLIAFSISSSLSETFQSGTVFPAFILFIGLVFIDNMIRMPLFIIASCAVFIGTSFMQKPPSVSKVDTIYGLIFTSIALIFHFRFQRSRVEQFLAYHKNREIQRDLEVRSSFDTLSSLLMRGRFFSLAETVFRTRANEEFVALCLVDLDYFKQINDKFGHQMGDKAIQTASGAIWDALDVDISEKWSFCERAAREHLSFAGRLGGDEFVILLRDDADWDSVMVRLEKILKCLNDVKLGELEGISASLGVTQLSLGDRDLDAVYARADEALYAAKTAGKNQIIKI